jgi:copper chaperone NosL
MRVADARLLLAGAAALLAATTALPLWSTRMEAPQYHGDEALRVRVYAGRVTGDLKEIDTLNHYIGVRLPLDVPELAASRWALWALVALAAGVLLAPRRIRGRLATGLLVTMLASVVGGAGILQYRLYEMGHVRGHSALADIPPFTPPILGSMKFANFHVHTRLELGAYAFLLAGVLVGAAAIVDHRGRAGARRSVAPCVAASHDRVRSRT